jgi:hypothetical protein
MPSAYWHVVWYCRYQAGCRAGEQDVRLAVGVEDDSTAAYMERDVPDTASDSMPSGFADRPTVVIHVSSQLHQKVSREERKRWKVLAPSDGPETAPNFPRELTPR